MSVKPEHIIERQGKQYVLYGGLLSQAHENGLLSIHTELLQIPSEENGHTAICRAVVKVKDENGEVRSFSGIGDANAHARGAGPAEKSAPIRMGETRAKSRALRDAVNAGELSVDGDDSTQEEPQERPQEATVASAQSGRGNPPSNSGAARGGANSASSGQAATDSQIRFLTRLAGEYSSVEKLEESVGCKLSDLSKRDAQRYIGELRSRLGYADEESE